jgi:epoxide hydrolase A/B
MGGRGLTCLPTNPFGERRQSEVEQWIAGPDLIVYHEYFAGPGLMEAEFERDVRGWIEAGLYSLSALPPIPPQLANLDLAALSDEQLAEVIRATPMCLPVGALQREPPPLSRCCPPHRRATG